MREKGKQRKEKEAREFFHVLGTRNPTKGKKGKKREEKRRDHGGGCRASRGPVNGERKKRKNILVA